MSVALFRGGLGVWWHPVAWKIKFQERLHFAMPAQVL